MNSRKLLVKLLSGKLQNVRFGDFQELLEDFGFDLSRISGSHHIYTHEGINDIINIQNVKGQAKPYQIRQALKLIELYNLSLED